MNTQALEHSALNEARLLASQAISSKARRTAEQVRWLVEPLHREGIDTPRIAMALNAKRIATPAGRLGWNKDQVRRTLGYLGLK